MKVVCRYGHVALYPSTKGDVVRFQNLFKVQLYRVDDYFTFLGLTTLSLTAGIVGLPRWSQIGRLFGNLPALVTFEGREPWDVMKANDFVYSFVTKLLVPRASIVGTITLSQTLDCASASSPLIQPGSLIPAQGTIIVGYSGFIDMDFQKLYIYSQETFP